MTIFNRYVRIVTMRSPGVKNTAKWILARTYRWMAASTERQWCCRLGRWENLPARNS
jgi:hypothetical protein